MAYNFLREARSIHNSFLCMHDTLDGYSSDFHLNGDVDGWDIYNSIYLYGCWNGVLFGTTYERTCYVSRAIDFLGVAAEYYYVLKIMMKITDNNIVRTVDRLTTGRVQWTRIGDSTWDSVKQVDFDIIADDKWRLYTINMGPMQWWQGDVNNLRIYPFIDGKSGDEFAIKYIKISSQNSYACDNTQCSYYLNYEHSCPGGGNRGSCESGLQNVTYTTISGVSDKFIINIDEYGAEKFDLGTNENVSPIEMSKILANKIASVGIGGYAYAQVEYSENDNLKIYSGTVGNLSSVEVVDSTGARALGFYDNDGNPIFTTEGGSSPVDGFDYASSRLMTALEINKLVDGKTDSFAYIHNPEQYNVEGGRRDFNEIGISRLLSSVSAGDYYESLSNKGKTLIDLSHPINNNGRIKAIYMYGVVSSLAKVKILRPKRDGTFTVIYSLDMPQESDSYLYTMRPITYRVDCDILVSRGDVIAIYNADIYVGVTVTSAPDASFQQLLGDLSVGDVVDAGHVYSFGVAGFAIYARGDRAQNNVLLDIDIGDRINIEEMNIYGREESDEFEFNIACCLDLSWSVNLYGRSHKHNGVRWTDGYPFSHTHQNIAYGHDCLDDCIRTADNGRQGDSYTSGANGMATYGHHAYFYCDGDAEWLYNFECTGKTEYCWPYVPYGVVGFTRDPISFTLTFPYGFTTKIHKSIIYFKERNNFRNIELSYGLGSYNYSGNAYRDSNFKRVPNYTSIKLDGLEYLPDSNDLVNDYVFNNPTNDDVRYATASRYNPINWEEYRASLFADWVILEHNFAQIECAGFRIYTDKHNSTKIMEMELYSKMATSPSLLDNVSLSFSDYGDVWTDVLFEEVNDSKISGFMGGAPRYMRLDIESATKFDLNEIECLVGDQVKIEDCADVVLLNDAPNERIGQSTSINLENVYDKSFDLSVDIPKEISDGEDIIFWSKLGSEDDIDDPQIGPGCKLYKSDDYIIGNDNGQCAINTPAYGLKNLVDGKNAYYMENTEDWVLYDTLTSGTSIDYCNENSYKYTEFTFLKTSSEYCKFGFPDILNYTMGFTKSSDWSTYYGTSQCTFTYDVTNYFSPLDFRLVDAYVGHDMVYKHVTPTLDNTTSFEVRFTVTPEASYSYVFAYLGMINEKAGNGHPMGVYFVLRPYNNNCGLRIVNSSASYNERWNGSYSNGNTYYVKLWGDGATHYYAKVWSDNWDGSALVSNCSVTSSLIWTSSKFGITNGFDGGTTGAYISGVLKEAVFCIKDVIAYDDDDRKSISKIYYSSIDGVTHQSEEVSCDGVYLNTQVSIRPDNNAFGIKLNPSQVINRIKLIHTEYSIGAINMYASPDNGDNYIIIDDNDTGTLNITTNNQNYYAYFAINLEERHNLDIIRNYGDATNKLWLSTSSNVEYSNSDVSDVDDVVWGNSTKIDTKWMRVKLLCGDGTVRCIRKLGIYPDITTAYCIGGGYNCEWHPLGNILADYYAPINVAYESLVSGTSMWYRDFYPGNAVDGVYTDYREQACWGFDDSEGDPYLEMNFTTLRRINKVVLYHGYSPADAEYMNVDYNFQVSTTLSGEDFITVFSISGNSEFERTHQFDPVYAIRARLTITDYDHGRLLIIDPDTNEYEAFLGSFLREIEIYDYTDLGYINSEDWPVVSMNLLDQFQITNHALFNKDQADTDTDWDNDEDYFKYSDNHFDDPEKVVFRREGSEVEAYSTTDTSGDVATASEYVFDEDVYFAAGFYNVEWQSYYNQSEDEISLTFDGPGLVELYAEQISTTWADETGVVEIPLDGFYTIKVVQHINPENHWGGRNIYVYRMAGLTKWVSVKRDTAENYSWDDDSDKYGKDYLSLIKIFGDSKYPPTEYSWWWQSTVSTLDNDALIVKTGSRSFKIAYPTYSGIDVVQFMEGDDFGTDVYFSGKDLLHCWLYIDNVNRLDTMIGDITFGIINDTVPAYYMWSIENMSLSTGWNNLSLKFEDANYTYPIGDDEDYLYGHLHEDLDFRQSGRDFTSFRIRYSGIGLPFNIYIDDLKIRRNKFDDDVRFDKGLCLSGQDYLNIPLAGITLERGAIEFWVKFYTDTYGIDIYGDMNSRTLFTMVNNNNDLISLGIKSGVWLEPDAGHVRKSLNLFEIDANLLPPQYVFSIGDTAHLALVWSNDGKYLDNKDTMRLYINGDLVAKSNVPWDVEDTKSAVIKLGGSNTQLALNKEIFGSAIFQNVKIYNFCKTEFNPNENGISKDKVYTPNEFLEISSDNINFHDVGSDQLPIIFSQVPVGESRIIYVRTNKNKNFGRSKTTANLIVQWLTTV